MPWGHPGAQDSYKGVRSVRGLPRCYAHSSRRMLLKYQWLIRMNRGDIIVREVARAALSIGLAHDHI